MQTVPQHSPLVSIVTPVYNAERFLEKTLRSVQAQTYSHWEQWLIIDSNCRDGSLQIAQRFASQDSRIQILQSPGFKGAARNRNAGLNAARGEYIAFLDADDLWLPEKLERQLHFMRQRDSAFCCHQFTPIDETGKTSGPVRICPSEIGFADLLRNNSIGCLTVMLRKDFLGDHRFPEIKHEDLALWLELLKSGQKAQGLPENLALYRVLATSYSGNKLKSAIWRWGIYRSIGISTSKSLLYLMAYVISALKKRL